MTVRLSSGLKDAMASNFGLGAMFVGGEFRIYDGVQPETADMPPNGTLVATITSMNQSLVPQGLQFSLSLDSGAIQTDTTLYTVLTVLEANRPLSWFRLMQANDSEEQSIIAPRLDFSFGDAAITEMPESYPEATMYLVSSLRMKLL